jgi:hypothetical protein
MNNESIYRILRKLKRTIIVHYGTCNISADWSDLQEVHILCRITQAKCITGVGIFRVKPFELSPSS